MEGLAYRAPTTSTDTGGRPLRARTGIAAGHGLVEPVYGLREYASARSVFGSWENGLHRGLAAIDRLPIGSRSRTRSHTPVHAPGQPMRSTSPSSNARVLHPSTSQALTRSKTITTFERRYNATARPFR